MAFPSGTRWGVGIISMRKKHPGHVKNLAPQSATFSLPPIPSNCGVIISTPSRGGVYSRRQMSVMSYHTCILFHTSFLSVCNSTDMNRPGPVVAPYKAPSTFPPKCRSHEIGKRNSD